MLSQNALKIINLIFINFERLISIPMKIKQIVYAEENN